MSQTFSYLATFEPAPTPFSYTPKLHQRYFRRGVFALLTRDVAQFEAAFGHLFKRIAGLIVTEGATLEFRPKGPFLWLLTLPPTQHNLLATLTDSYLQIIAAHRAEFQMCQKQQLEIDRIAADLEYWTNYSELIQDRLRRDLHEYTEWTVQALTELLQFSTQRLQSAELNAYPNLIVNFLRHDVFDDVAAAMLGPSGLPLARWEILAQTDGWNAPLKLTDVRYYPDVWQRDNHLFVPFTVDEVEYIIILSSGRSKNSYSDYELTFYRLFSTILEAIYASKLNEQALNRALKTKDEFLANMSHELRTPLNAILGRAEAMQAGIYGTVTPKQSKALKTIEESGAHLLSLINDVLTFAKMEAEALEIDLIPVDLHALCDSSLRLVRDQASQKRIKVLFTIDHDIDHILADERRLKQILLNLLSNAVKFTPEGGRVMLTVIGDEHNEVVQLTVSDTGIGIAEEQLKRLFKPFVQLDSKLSRQYEGTGLGLALVDRLVRLHGGNIQVVSEPHRGSEFIVSLPWKVAPKAFSPAVEPEPESFQPAIRTDAPLILLAEDNSMNREMVVEFLEFLDYQVIVAVDGAEAVRQARAHLPDLILMDVQMPILDGLAATQQLRADSRTQHLKIVALTGLAMSGDRERCLAAEVNDYLTKPVSLKTLQEIIEVQLERNPLSV